MIFILSLSGLRSMLGPMVSGVVHVRSDGVWSGAC